jgi:hypothetical protein
MVVYNRRKRAIYFENLEKEQAKILQSARDAVAEGVATPAQTALVEGIREEEEAMERKKAERRMGTRLMWWLHGDWNEEKALKEQRRLAVEDFKQQEAAASEGLGITQAVQEARANATTATTTAAPATTVGGPLDQVAAHAAENAEKTSKGLFGWAFRSKKSD